MTAVTGMELERVRSMPCLVRKEYGRRSINDTDAERWPVCSCHESGCIDVRPVAIDAPSGRFGVVPLCSTHHCEAGEAGTSQRTAFERRYGLDLRRIADTIALEHSRPLGIRGLADRWYELRCWQDARRLTREAGEAWVLGDSDEDSFILDDHERDALLGWVHREMGREVERRAERLRRGPRPAVLGGWLDADHCEDPTDLEELTHHVAQALGFDAGLGAGDTVWTLCEAAAECFGGWPT